MGERPQAIINRQLVDDADLLFAVFSTRLGSPTGVAESGTAEEIERLRGMQKPVLVYFSQAPLLRNHNVDEPRRCCRFLNRFLLTLEIGAQAHPVDPFKRSTSVSCPCTM
jgi:hypothetical protein